MDTIKDIMTTKLLIARDDWSLDMLSQFFFDHQISGAPVIDNNENLVGIVSLSDLARTNTLAPIRPQRDSELHEYYQTTHHYHGISQEDMILLNEELESAVTVKDIMTPMIFEVDENTPIREAADMMLKGHIHRLFVTRDKKVVGIVTTMDMLKVIREKS